MDVFCTIVARNYLHHARLLARSLRQHHPDAPFVCLVTDGPTGQDWDDANMNLDPGLCIMTAHDLPLDPSVFSAMAFMYNVIELATALKPVLLRSLFDEYEAVESATYLDPDTFLYAPIPTVRDSVGEAVALLTPHRLTPPPLDGFEPKEALFLRHGAFNLGYVSVNARSSQFLAWWSDRLTVDAVISNRESLFTDQKWMDLAHVYFNMEQLRDPGVNVAWWNIDERILRQVDGKTTVNGGPLRMAHYSGYRPGKQAPIVRERSSLGHAVSLGVFEQLADDYLRLVSMELGAERNHNAYEFSNFIDGRPISKYDRRKYRSSVRAEIIAGRPVDSAPWDRSPTFVGRLQRSTFAVIDATVGYAIPWEMAGQLVRRRGRMRLLRGRS